MRVTEPAAARRYRVADLIVDTGTREVRRGGKRLNLPGLSFDLLQALIDAAPNLLTHEELVERVWAGRIVSPETITQRIKLVRDALGDDAGSPTYIGAERGHGYRLLPPVVVHDGPGAVRAADERAADTSTRSRTPVLLFVLAAVVVAAWLLSRDAAPPADAPVLAADTVAVLPFRHASRTETDRYLSVGVGEYLRDQLSRVDGLRVVARTSSQAALASGADAKEMAARLGAARLIEGKVSRTGNVLEVSAGIVDGRTGLTLWSRNYEQASSSLLTLQQLLLTDVVAALADGGTILTAPEPPPSTLSSQDLMLLARYYERQVREQQIVDRELLLRAIELYREVVKQNPGSALAHGRYAAALLYDGDTDTAQAPMLRALALDPNLAEVQYTAGLYYLARRLPGAGDAFRRAIESNPNDADALAAYAWWIWHQGDNEAPERLYRQALTLDPLSLSRHGALSNFYGWSGRAAQAREVAEQALATFDGAGSLYVMAKAEEAGAELDAAIAWMLKALERAPGDTESRWYLAELFALIGDEATAFSLDDGASVGLYFHLRRYDELIALGEEQMLDYPNDVRLKYLLAFAYNAVQEPARAVRILTIAGVPDSFRSDARDAPAAEAAVTLLDSLRATGRTDRAADLAARLLAFMDRHIETGSRDWWPFVYGACAELALGRRDAALGRLAGAFESPRLPRLPVLADSPCFRDIDDERVYQELLAQVMTRRDASRERLAATLERHEVSLSLVSE